MRPLSAFYLLCLLLPLPGQCRPLLLAGAGGDAGAGAGTAAGGAGGTGGADAHTRAGANATAVAGVSLFFLPFSSLKSPDCCFNPYKIDSKPSKYTTMSTLSTVRARRELSRSAIILSYSLCIRSICVWSSSSGLYRHIAAFSS